MSVFVNLIPQSGHFLFLLIVVSSIHLLQNRCGQVLSTTSRYLSPVQLHIILPLYSYSSILSNSFFSALEFRLSRRVFQLTNLWSQRLFLILKLLKLSLFLCIFVIDILDNDLFLRNISFIFFYQFFLIQAKFDNLSEFLLNYLSLH